MTETAEREYWALYAPDRVIRDGEECERRCVAFADTPDGLAAKTAGRDWGGPGFYEWSGMGNADTIPEALAAAGDAWDRLRGARPRAVAEHRLKGEKLNVWTAHSGGACWSVSADEQIVEPIVRADRPPCLFAGALAARQAPAGFAWGRRDGDDDGVPCE